MVLSDHTIKLEIAQGPHRRSSRAIRTTSSPRASTCTSVHDFQVFRNSRYPYIDPAREQPGLTERVTASRRGAVRAAPRRVRARHDRRAHRACPMTSSAASRARARSGVSGCSSTRRPATSIPGWDGTLTLELSNVANLPIVLVSGDEDRSDLVLADDDARSTVRTDTRSWAASTRGRPRRRRARCT